MEFWGAAVKVGQSLYVDPSADESYIHISQAALGESKKDKGNEPVVLYVKVGDQKLVLGTLNREKIPQITLEAVLDKEFELSHNSKTASVHFIGYKAFYPQTEDEYTDSDDDEMELPPIPENGKTEVKVEGAKASQPKKDAAKAGAPAKQVKLVDPKNDNEDEDSDEDDDFGSSDDEMEDADSDDSDEEDDSDEDDDKEETPPKKVDQGKKRPNESTSKTPASTKKAKNATPEKTDGKKGGPATPHPAKKGGKTPNSDAKSPKSAGQFSCTSCSKTFNSESGFQQHNKAKHGQ